MSSELFRKYINIINEESTISEVSGKGDPNTSTTWAQEFVNRVGRVVDINDLKMVMQTMYNVPKQRHDKRGNDHWIFYSPASSDGTVMLEFPMTDYQGNDIWYNKIGPLQSKYMHSRRDEIYSSQPMPEEYTGRKGKLTTMAWYIRVPQGLSFEK